MKYLAVGKQLDPKNSQTSHAESLFSKQQSERAEGLNWLINHRFSQLIKRAGCN